KAARDPAVYVTPAWADARGSGAVTQKTALAMTVRHEAIGPVIDRLDQLYRDLSLRPEGPLFSVHLLSDSTDPEFAKAEEQAVADWRARLGPALATRVHYRRREQNTGFKAGNLAEFADRMGEEVDFFLPLDADSAMSADAVLRLVRVMEAHPEIGLLQGLVVGAPTASLFARMFQFGMRQGMRSYTTGSAWWQGDCGPFWGHNAVVRIKPFRDHCRLPVLPGSSALSGPILSHDQVEAVLLRRAGYEVRVVAQEEESYEENPPSLLDFIKRDLRWCHGNMQYFKLLGMPKLHLLGRVQLALAVLMYAGAPAWMAFILFGAAQAFHPAGFDTYSIDGLWLFLA
ncbi:MAG: glucans biosynthesis glucosyltransferase MdoH, partial [Rhodospirillaceae bacterium]